MTYLLFLKGLDEIETNKEAEAELFQMDFKRTFPKEKQNLRWSNFKNLSAEEMYKKMTDEVFPFMRNLSDHADSAYAKYVGNALFEIPTPLLLSKIVDGIDKLQINEAIDKKDTKGDLYEYLLSKLSTSGTNGQFRTPRHIIDMMVKLMKPTPTDIIADPAAGSAGFLVSAQDYLRQNHSDLFLMEELNHHFNNDMFHGFDTDETMLRIGAMNLLLHGVDNPNVSYKDSLSEENKDTNKYTLILANPPFKGSLDHESVSADLLKITKTKKTELLFLALMLRSLKLGGRCAVIVPDGVLFGSTKGHKDLRKEIVANNKLEAVISMPSGVFKPYAGVSTAILIFTKTNAGGTDNVWFYDMKADGYSLDDKRNAIEANDIPDILKRFDNLKVEADRKRTERSFFVPVSEIEENSYDLSINKYKEIEYEEVEYEEPSVIMQRIKELEVDIQKGFAELEALLGE